MQYMQEYKQLTTGQRRDKSLFFNTQTLSYCIDIEGFNFIVCARIESQSLRKSRLEATPDGFFCALPRKGRDKSGTNSNFDHEN